LTDETGIVWRADAGFTDGDTIDRAGLTIPNTKTPSLYRAERYAMSAFHWKLPNGKYTVKLHFAETYEDITGPGERVFSFKVGGREFKDFDGAAKRGQALHFTQRAPSAQSRRPRATCHILGDMSRERRGECVPGRLGRRQATPLPGAGGWTAYPVHSSPHRVGQGKSAAGALRAGSAGS
jgi:hypothetical protein